MSLMQLTDAIRDARAAGRIVPAFNVDSVDMAVAVVKGAERRKSPFILQVTSATLDIWGWDSLAGWLLDILRRAAVPSALVLDHAGLSTHIDRAVGLGFSGVMYDGSALPIAENIRTTQALQNTMRDLPCYFEAEVGHVARDGEPPEWAHLTTVKEARDFVRATNIDALAVAVGTRHGSYRRPEDIRLDRLVEIAAAVNIPLVLHGGSGLPDPMFSQLSRGGIAKVNIGTALRTAWWTGVAESTDKKPRQALERAMMHVGHLTYELIGKITTQTP